MKTDKQHIIKSEPKDILPVTHIRDKGELKKSNLAVARLDPQGAEPNDDVLSIMEVLSTYKPIDVKRAFKTYFNIHEKESEDQDQMSLLPSKRKRTRSDYLTDDKDFSDEEDDDEEEGHITVFDVNTLQISQNNIISAHNRHYNKSRPSYRSVKKESNIDTASCLQSPTSSDSTFAISSRAISEQPQVQSDRQKTERRRRCTGIKEIPLFVPLASDILPQLREKDFVVSDVVLGTGQMSVVKLGRYGNLPIACKSKRSSTNISQYYVQARRELDFAARLSTCRYMNRYLGWAISKRSEVEENYFGLPKNNRSHHLPKLYIVQRYINNRDCRAYLNSRETALKPQEILQASICLFSALTDAHSLNIGFVDLKLENFLIDSSGAGCLTDFGSCVMLEKGQNNPIDLNLHEVSWTSKVAPPEMLNSHQFSKASDVFMATVILAEMMTPEISHRDFQRLVLRRYRHKVEFSSTHIHEMYQEFFPLLKAGLANSPNKRPTAQAMLDTLLEMRQK